MQLLASDVMSLVYQKILMGPTRWSSRSGGRPRVLVIYPDSAGRRLLSGAVAVATHLLVAALSFWIGSHPTERFELTDELSRLQKFSLTQKEEALVAKAQHVPTSVEAIDELPPSWKDMTVDGLTISHAQFSRVESSANKLVYDLTLVNKGRRFIGNLEIKISGTLQGREGVHTHSGFSGADSRAQPSFINVSNFLQTRGEIPLPEGFKPKVVFVKLLEHEEIRASKAIWMHEETRFIAQR